MAYSEERLYQGVPGTSEATVYTVPSTLNGSSVKRVQVKEIVIANTTNTPASISLSIVPSGQTAGNANRIVPATSVNANSTVRIGLSQVMYVGDFISGLQGTASAITVTISGVVRS